jgi:hypothetical protein
MEDEERIRDFLSESYMVISKGGSLFHDIDSFVALSRRNTSVETVHLYPFDRDERNYEFWDKVGEMVGNLTELQMINISFLPYIDDNGGYEAHVPDWEIITRIMRYLRRTVALCACRDDYDAEAEEVQGLAGAIHGHPMISEFCSQVDFTFENLGPWCSALATLPYLKRVTLGLQQPETDERVNPEPLTELLRAPALRYVEFEAFSFTYALCYAVANALEEGSAVTDITFNSNCSFPDGGKATIVNALKTNASVTDANFICNFDEPFCNSLAAVLLCNSTLQNLTVCTPGRALGRWLSSIFLSLGMNTTLNSLSVSISDEFRDELCAAIRSGLAKNSTLEKLSLSSIVLSDDNGPASASSARSFLRTNSTLKSLTVCFKQGRTLESCVSAFRLEAVKMVEESPFLESLTLTIGYETIKSEAFLALISALQLNTTLKTLGYQLLLAKRLYLTDDEVNQLASILMKNYRLEKFVPDIDCEDGRTVKAILRLNRAGRRYLIEDGSSISKGVEVLSAVNDDINCVFLHLLENPSLCDRRAAETTTRSRRPGANLDESSAISGKRERAQSQPGKEPRRRLA